MFYIIGLGLSNERDITVNGLEVLGGLHALKTHTDQEPGC